MRKKGWPAILLAAVTAISAAVVSRAVSGTGETGYPDLRAGRVYSIMNCDTGRDFGVGDTTDFLFESAGTEGAFYLKDPASGQYLQASENGVSLSGSHKDAFFFTRLQYNRYAIGTGSRSFSDTDGGETGLAVLSGVSEVRYLNACWFVTADGMTKPLRIMPLGDSLTYGDDIDNPTAEYSGYRALLSVLLAERFPNLRFAFVGSQTKGGTGTADGLELYRSEGHNAHTVYDLDYGAPYYGIYQLCDAWLAKYQPDVVSLMLGTNDIGLNGTMGDSAAAQTAGYQLRLMKKIREQAPVRMFLLATSPPRNGDSGFNRVMSLYNELLEENAAKIRKSGTPVEISDVYALIESIGPTAFCSDNGHMSRLGYDEIAKLHAKILTESAFIQETAAKIGSEIRTLSEGADVDSSADPDSQSRQSDEAGITSSPMTGGVWTPIIVGAAVTAAAVAGGICLVRRTKKEKK